MVKCVNKKGLHLFIVMKMKKMTYTKHLVSYLASARSAGPVPPPCIFMLPII